MTAQSPSGPDPETTADTAHALADALLSLSRQILDSCHQPELPALGQMVLHRGRLLQQLGQLKTDSLSADSQAQLQDKLDQCRQMDEVIEQRLKAHRADMEEQLKTMKESRALMEKYRAGNRELSTHQEDA